MKKTITLITVLTLLSCSTENELETTNLVNAKVESYIWSKQVDLSYQEHVSLPLEQPEYDTIVDQSQIGISKVDTIYSNHDVNGISYRETYKSIFIKL